MYGDLEGARSTLEAAFDANPESEQIWLAAFKFEAQNGQWTVARQLLEKARSIANTERVRCLPSSSSCQPTAQLKLHTHSRG